MENSVISFLECLIILLACTCLYGAQDEGRLEFGKIINSNNATSSSTPPVDEKNDSLTVSK